MKSFVVSMIWIGLLSLMACSPTSEASQTVATPDSTQVNRMVSGSQKLYAKRESATHGEIEITVDQGLKPVIESTLATFMAVHPEASIHAHYLPGEEAISYMLAHHNVRLAISTRELTEAETGVLRERLITPNYASIAKEGIAVLVHPDNPVTRLTQAQLRDLLIGELKTWQAISPEAPAGNIRLVFDHPQSSTLRYVRDSLLGSTPLKQEDIYSQSSTLDLLRYVSQTPQAIAFGSWAWLSDQDDPLVDSLRRTLQVVALQRPDDAIDCVDSGEFFGPYQGYLAQGCYPLVRHITTIRRETINGLGAGLIAYLVGPKGQRILHKAGLAAIKGIPREIRLPEKPKKPRSSEQAPS